MMLRTDDTTPNTTHVSTPWPLIGATSLTLLTCILAIAVWGHMNDWQLIGLSTYQVFPVLGLLAFSIMWSQYIVEALKNYVGRESILDRYFGVTSWFVLLFILLHPGLLIMQRFRDGYGLPPGSYVSYVAPIQHWVVLLGSMSLMVFLAFELKHFFGKKSWWPYVLLANDVAIVAIFYHGLRLGQQLQAGWYQTVWYVYGVLLAGALAYKYYYRYSGRTAAKSVEG